jgi:tryptophan-rich sensory protein
MMSFPSIIFFLIFLIPLVGFLVWLMKEDKRKGKIGLMVLGFMVIAGIMFMYLMTRGE